MPKLTDTEIQTALAELPGWSLTGAGVTREFDLEDYPAAIAAVTRVGFAAEAADHHPDIAINWKRVTFSLITHSEGGVTEKDVAMAKTISALLGD